MRRRPLSAALQALLLLAFLALSVLAGFTGYLGPPHGPPADEEARIRFTVLHLFVLPALIGTLAFAWLWLLWPGNQRDA